MYVCVGSRWKVTALRQQSGHSLTVREHSTQYGKNAGKIARKTKPTRWQRVRSFLTVSNVLLVLLWACFIALLVQINAVAADRATFEPYSILGLQEGASEAEVRKAYRDLSRKYHPDKNPDPKAHKFFSEKVTKAYEALADEQGKKNYELYGHPDGKRSLDIGVALPNFFFESDSRKQTLLLFLIVGIGILLPLFIAVRYLLHSGKYSQGHVLKNTNAIFAYLVSEQMKPERILEVLIRAEEFTSRKMTKGEHKVLTEYARSIGVNRAELYQAQQGNKMAKKQQQNNEKGPVAEIVRTRTLCMAQLQQDVPRLPSELWDSYVDAMSKAPHLLATFTDFAFHPPREKADKYSFGFLQPAMNAIHLSACLTHGVPLASENLDTVENKQQKKSGKEKKLYKDKQWPSLMQAPHMTEAIVRDLIGKYRIMSLWDLVRMDPELRNTALGSHLSQDAIKDIEAFMRELPFLALSASVETEGHEVMYAGDVITCNVNIASARCKPSSSSQKKESKKLTHPPLLPNERTERWYVILADQGSQRVLASEATSMAELPYDFTVKQAIANGSGPAVKVSKKESEQNGTKGDTYAATNTTSATTADRKGDETAESVRDGELVLEEMKSVQQMTLKTMLPTAGTWNLEVHVVSDMWVGCDVKESIKKEVQGTVESKSTTKKKLTGKERRQLAKSGQNMPQRATENGDTQDEQADDEDEDTGENDDDLDADDDEGTEESSEGAESDADFLVEKGEEDKYVGIGCNGH